MIPSSNRKPLFAVVLLFLLCTPLLSLQAQNNPVVITIGLPQIVEALIPDDFDDDFESQNPDIDVQFVVAEFDTQNEDRLVALQDYASQADVLLTNQTNPESTRAGLFIDLSPLLRSDPDFDPSDFYRGVWEAFQWDRGVWGLPSSATADLLFYNPDAFDAQGLRYPDPSWTLADLETAARALTTYNDDGAVDQPALITLGSDTVLALSLSGASLVDDSFVPSEPRLDDPALAETLVKLAELRDEGMIVPFSAGGLTTTPMRLDSGVLTALAPDENTVATLLPGGRAGISTNGFSVSAGTQNIEAAYRVVKFLSESPRAVGLFPGGLPARRSLLGADVEAVLDLGFELPPETEFLVVDAFETGISGAETRFPTNLGGIIQELANNPEADVNTLLDDRRTEILDRLTEATDRRAELQEFVVAPPDAGPQLAAGEVELTFGLGGFGQNVDAWNQLAQDFAARDPEVGLVTIEEAPFFLAEVDSLAETYDCFYVGSNEVPDANLDVLLSLDPLLSSDSTYNEFGMVGGTIERVRREDRVWGLPLQLTPLVLRYDGELFDQYGLNRPFNSWTVEGFESALRTLRDVETDIPPFNPGLFPNSLLLLMASYGGLPLDYRTSPPTINFTDPAAINAMREVLDFARDDLIVYNGFFELDNFFGGDDDNIYAIFSDLVGGLQGAFGGDGDDADEDNPFAGYTFTNFPRGTNFSAAAYDMAVAHISATTALVEPCYRFIREAAQSADILTQMPASRDVIDSFDYATARGDDVAAYYASLDDVLRDPNTLVFPLFAQDNADIMLFIWLGRAFDRYVEEDADLEVELAEAQRFTEEAYACVDALPPFDFENDSFLTFFGQIRGCAVNVDPTSADFFSF